MANTSQRLKNPAHIGFTMDREEHVKLINLCRSHGVSVNFAIRRAIRDMIMTGHIPMQLEAEAPKDRYEEADLETEASTNEEFRQALLSAQKMIMELQTKLEGRSQRYTMQLDRTPKRRAVLGQIPEGRAK